LIQRNRLSLSNRGEQAAYLPALDASGIFFFGKGMKNIYTEENIYWLSEDDGLLMETVSGDAPEQPEENHETFMKTLHVEEDLFPAIGFFTNPHADYWGWDYFFSGTPGSDTKSFPFQVSGVSLTSEMASLIIYLKGLTDTFINPDHHVEFALNGTSIGETYWSGIESHGVTLEFEHNLLEEGENVLSITGMLDTGAPYSIFYLDSFDISYHRLYRASNDQLAFPASLSMGIVMVSGFTTPEIYLFDITDSQRPLLVTSTSISGSGEDYTLSFVPYSDDSTFVALSADAMLTEFDVFADGPSDLKASKNSADYLIITPSEMKDESLNLANYRQGQGLDAMVVELEDIMDEFSHGIYNPIAIRTFLDHAYVNWKKPPKYVVLVGAGTFDYKDHNGLGSNVMPPVMVYTQFGLFPSDNFYADVNGDYVPEYAIGRLPVATADELKELIGKIIAYESSGDGDWKERILMLADNPDVAGNFPTDSDDVAALAPPNFTVERIYLSQTPAGEAHQLAIDGLNRGALLLNYIGHGSVVDMAEEKLLSVTDMDSLTNGQMLPVVTAMTCGVGQFAIPGYESLAQGLIMKNQGGAVAVWAPSGLSFNKDAVYLNRAFFQSAFVEGERILGDVILKSLKDYSSTDGDRFMLDIYNLFGDPATQIGGN
jgi:hypothetical protein